MLRPANSQLIILSGQKMSAILLLECILLGLLTSIARGDPRDANNPPPPSEGLLYDPLAPIVKTEFSVILLPRDTDCYYHYVPKYAVMQFQFRVSFFLIAMGKLGYYSLSGDI